MLKIGDIIEVEIEKIVFGGEGLAYYNQIVIFVPLSAIGDRLQVKIISVKKTYARGLIEKILLPSKDRITAEKISFEDNSGCDFNHLKYEKQLEYKTKMLEEMFFSISKIDIKPIYNGIVPSLEIKNYRNKVAQPFVKIKDKIYLGFYKRKSHDTFAVEEDLLKSDVAKKVEEQFLNELNKEKFTVYNEKNHTGFLKSLIIRNNRKGETMLCVVINKTSLLPKLKKVLARIYEENSFIKSIYISIKEKKNNIILGEKNILLFGEKYISENIFSINFKIYLDSFFQINVKQVEKLYNTAYSMLDEVNNLNIIDAFSGTGTIGMILAKKYKKVYCIESVASSVKSAIETAKENGIKNIEFICAKVENSIDKILKRENIDSIIFDPPRKGLEKSVIEAVANKKIKNIIYISCEPSRFARDLNMFIEKGYKLKKITAVDMFPNTHHVETVVLMSKVGIAKA